MEGVVQLLGFIRERFSEVTECRVPFRLFGLATFGGRSQVGRGCCRHSEGVRSFPLQVFFRQAYFLVAQGVSVGRCLAGFIGTAVSDHRAADYQAGLSGLCFGSCQGCGDRLDVIPVNVADHVPAVCPEPLVHVLAEGDVSVALDGYLIVVIEHDELAQCEGAGHGGGLRRDAFLQIAVRNYGVGVVVDDLMAGFVEPAGQPALGQSHANSVAEALAQGAGGGLHAGGYAVFGMARGLAAPLPKLLEFVHG